MVGRTLAHYRINATIGAGGMGEVYRATDTKLGRDVALKVLPADVARDPERLARFQREARAVAALNHPHIVTLFSVEEADGVHFLTMELVEGQPLDRLIPTGGLPVEQIFEIASSLAEALAAAHEKGIIHRDLKPANVMVTSDGRLKVLDFGLAKDVRAESTGDATLTSAGHTQAGIVMGTPAYMSPEQVSGRALDQRSDIFSLGVMLHEMATGRRPFEGTSSAELVSAILRDTPPPVTDMRADLPGDLARIIRRCMEKDPRYRVQTARDVSNEFRDLARTSSRVTPGPTPASRAATTPDSGSARAEEGFWVAVLPFKYKGADSGLEALAEGLTEEIITGLSRFSYLRVIARGSTAKYSSESGDVRAIGKELGARYVMEGSIRQAGSTIRLAVQLVDATTGAHLWAETFERDFRPDEIFALQDQLVPRIVSTVADTHGVLPYSMSQTLRNRNPDELTPYEALLRGFAYFKHVNAVDHEGARAALERAVQQAPGNADCWAMLAMLYREENNHGFNLRPDPVGRALAAARRAVDTAPSNHLAHHALASVLFFRRETQAFRSAAQRAIELNPMDGFTIGYMGFLISYSGDWERGCALMEQARNLNPNHPGWYWFPPFFNAYRKGDYRAALEFALKVNMPGFWRNELALAATYGQLGELHLARNAARELLAVRPGFDAVAREECSKWWDPELVDQIIEGLRKAGLEIGDSEKASEKAKSAPKILATVPRRALEEVSTQDISGSKRRTVALATAVGLFVIAAAGVGVYLKMSRAGAIDSIAVLPLENRSNDPESDYIADGVTESINNSLARLSGLSVIPHSVASHYKGKQMDVRKVGDELRVQAVLAGRVAQRGDNLTIEVELDDVRNGKQLWGEQYNRKLSDLLAVQSEIAREVSQRLRSQLSADDRQKLTKGSTDSPEAYQLYLKGKYYTNKLTKDGFRRGLDYFNQAVAVDPNYGLAYSGMAYNYMNQDDWFMSPNEAAPKAKDAAEKALAIDNSDVGAHLSLAIEAHWYEWNWATSESEFKRAIELSPNNAEAHGYYSWFLATMGRHDQALAEARRSQQLDPLSPLMNGFVGSVLVFNRQPDAAITELRNGIELDPTFWFFHTFLGSAYLQKGKMRDAIAEYQRALQLEKDNAEIWSGLAYSYAVSGNKPEARKLLDHLQAMSEQNYVAPFNIAVVYLGLGDKEQAFAWLDRGYQQRSYYLAVALPTSVCLDSIRSDPRLADLRRRVGLPE